MGTGVECCERSKLAGAVGVWEESGSMAWCFLTGLGLFTPNYQDYVILFPTSDRDWLRRFGHEQWLAHHLDASPELFASLLSRTSTEKNKRQLEMN